MKAHLKKDPDQGILICNTITPEEQAKVETFLSVPQGCAATATELWLGARFGALLAEGHEPADEMEVGEGSGSLTQDTSGRAVGEYLQGTYTQPNIQSDRPWNERTAVGTSQEGTLDQLPDNSEGGSILTHSSPESPFATTVNVPGSSLQASQKHDSFVNGWNVSGVGGGIHGPVTGESILLQKQSEEASMSRDRTINRRLVYNNLNPLTPVYPLTTAYTDHECFDGAPPFATLFPPATLEENSIESFLGNGDQFAGPQSMHGQEPAVSTEDPAEISVQADNTGAGTCADIALIRRPVPKDEEPRPYCRAVTKRSLGRHMGVEGRCDRCGATRQLGGLVQVVASLFLLVEDNSIKLELRNLLWELTACQVSLGNGPLWYSRDFGRILLDRRADPDEEAARLSFLEKAVDEMLTLLLQRGEADQAIGWPLCLRVLGVVDALRELLNSESAPDPLLPDNSSAGGDSAGGGSDGQEYLTDGSPSAGDQAGGSNTAPQQYAPPGANLSGRRVSAGGAQGGSSKHNEAGRKSLQSVSSSAGDVEGDGPSETGATREEGEGCAIGAPLEEGVGNNLAAVAWPETAAADVSADDGETSVGGSETSAADVSADEGETSLGGPETSAADVSADEGETAVAAPGSSAADVSADEGETSETETEDEWDLLEDLDDIIRQLESGAGTPPRLDPTKPKESTKPKGSDTGDDSGDKSVRTIGSIRSSDMLVTKASQLTETERECWRKDMEGYGFKYCPPGSRTKYHNYPFMDGKGNYYRSYDEACDEADRRRGPGAKKVPRAGAYKQVS
ncbi:hypothetical protein KFL_000540270 [Klebsormidium nitens]|uniref:Uncharacterized protein n=1 Tax=Klebsormidium nitens TaxID=105231 RepID=A0A0U9HL04_KLENI|nr:hypothetical protein KFL_000540270 [Klebsormidium nitens]|eukprot:GAQ80452.1 hypothetical protein KFL_000540270 [Klebsormidium nitens]